MTRSATTPIPTAPPEPPPAPRQITARASRRAWGDPRVRTWLLLTLALLAITAYYGWSRVWEWHLEGVLIGSGTAVNATVTDVGDSRAGKKLAPGAAVALSFELNGKPQNVIGVLQDTKDFIVSGSTVPLRVDPNNPNHWTNIDRRGPLAPTLIGLAALVPLVLIVFAIAWWRRSKVMKTWTTGSPAVGLVINKHQTPLAPLAQAVRCTMRDSLDKQLHTVFVPGSFKVPPRGEVIWLLTPTNGRGPVVAAAWFE